LHRPHNGGESAFGFPCLGESEGVSDEAERRAAVAAGGKQKRQIGQRRDVIGVCRQHVPIDGFGLVRPVLLAERRAKIVMRLRMIGLQRDGLPIGCDGLVQLSPRPQGIGEVDMGGCVTRLQRYRPPVMNDGLVRAAPQAQNAAQIDMTVHIIRLKRQRRAVTGLRFVQAAKAVQGVAKPPVRFQEIGLELYGPTAGRQAFFSASQPGQDHGEIGVIGRVLFVKADRLADEIGSGHRLTRAQKDQAQKMAAVRITRIASRDLTAEAFGLNKLASRKKNHRLGENLRRIR
jgi:hypothetical protein